MPEKQTKEPVESQEEKSFLRVIVHSFFIIPFLIAVFCVLLFAAINLLTSEKRTAYDYLSDVQKGGVTKRWQGAFELSKIIANDKVNQDPKFAAQLIDAFKQAKHDDNRVRQYLALAMGRTNNSQYIDPLLESIPDAKNENLSSIIYALGMLKDEKAIIALHPLMEHPNDRVRSITAVSLGNIGSSISVPVLENALTDKEANVQWGSAISLAQMGNTSGRSTVLKLLNRKYLSDFSEVDPDEQTNLIITAINASSKILDDGLLAKLKDLSMNDQNMKVRSAALKILEK